MLKSDFINAFGENRWKSLNLSLQYTVLWLSLEDLTGLATGCLFRAFNTGADTEIKLLLESFDIDNKSIDIEPSIVSGTFIRISKTGQQKLQDAYISKADQDEIQKARIDRQEGNYE